MFWSGPLSCDKKDLTKDLTGKTAIVTGGSTGIGKETAKQLFKQGATVVIASRNVDAGNAIVEEMVESGVADARERFLVQRLDLSDFASIRSFVDEFKGKHHKLHMLINNAGLMGRTFRRTKQGHELHMVTDMLVKTATSECPSRIVNTSSCAAVQFGPLRPTLPIDYEDFHWLQREKDSNVSPTWLLYGQSKLANVLHAMELNERLKDKNVISVSVHPGLVCTKMGSRLIPPFICGPFTTLWSYLIGMLDTWGGAQTTLHCCLTDELHGGAFYSQRATLLTHPVRYEGGDIGWPCTAPLPSAEMNPENAKKLWNISEACIQDSKVSLEKK